MTLKQVAVLALVIFPLQTLAATADRILFNGQILTADQDFTIAQALAIKGERILAVGSNAEVRALAGADTELIDLDGKTVIPGLIDNHVHIVRGSRMWNRDVRLDAVHSRAEALQRITDRARKLGPGEWIVVMGGFTPEQFDTERGPFTRQELDKAAPDNPVFMQLLFGLGYANTAAFRAIDIDEDTDIAWLEIANDIDLDADDQPTGTVRGAAMRRMLAKIAEPDLAQTKSRVLGTQGDLHAMGVTGFVDAAGAGLPLAHYKAFEALDAEGKLKLRVFSLYGPHPYQPGEESGLTGELKTVSFFQASDHFQRIGIGERLYSPIHDSMLDPAASAPEHQQAFANLARQVAAMGLSLQQHATHGASMRQHLRAFEQINQTHPIGELRWAFHHADGIDAAIIARAKSLGMGVAVHSRRLISGNSFNHPLSMLAFGNPPLRTLQASGITWGMGTDTMVVNQSNPFYTLWWAVSGRAMNGDKLTEETVTREQALVAHTRSNAWLAFREQDIGSLEPGKFADLLILDGDYLRVPEVEIRTLRPLLTIVGGEVVFRR